MSDAKIDKRGRTNELTGIVVSNKMDKTITVKVLRLVKHPKYLKYYRKTSTLKAHDADNSARIGDRVLVSETRPLSKTKRWKLKKIIEAAKI